MMGWVDSVEGFLSGPPGDVDTMTDAATDLDRMAGDLRQLARSLDQRVDDVLGGASAWRGPAARGFATRWQPVYTSLMAAATAFDDSATALRATAGPVGTAKDQHRSAMATMGVTAAATVAEVLSGGLAATAGPGHAAVQAVARVGGAGLDAALARATLEFERIAAVGRMVAATLPPPAAVTWQSGGTGMFDAVAALAIGERAWELEQIRAHLPAAMLPPEARDQSDAAAGFMAQRLTHTLDEDDGASLASLCAQLSALDRDPLFATALVTSLGPDAILRIAHVLRQLGDEERDTALSALDQALATASNSPGLDPTFISRLTRPPRSRDDLDDLAALFGTGVFSTPMLLAAARVADASVFSGTSPVLGALSRNPTAAQLFLLAGYDRAAAGAQLRPDPATSPFLPYADPGSNLHALLRHHTWDDDGRALGELLVAATTEAPGADPRLSAQIGTELVSRVAEYRVSLSDPLRELLATVVVAHPDWFTLRSGIDGGTAPFPDPDTGQWFATMSLGDEVAFLGELMRSDTATQTMVVGASAYLLRQLEDPRMDTARPLDAGRLFAMLNRGDADRLAHAHDTAHLAPAMLGLLRSLPQDRLVKDTELAVGSFVQILLDVDTWRLAKPTFKDRLVDALRATRAEALLRDHKVAPPHDPHLMTGTPGERVLKPYSELPRNSDLRSAYWQWVDSVTQSGDPKWEGVIDGFNSSSNS